MATTPPPNKPGAGKPAAGGNFLTQKMGPLPMWGWLVVAVGAFYLYKKIYGGASTAASGTTGSTSATTLPTETLTTAGGTYTGPIGSVPGSISNPIGQTNPTNPVNTPVTGDQSAGFGTYSYGGQTYDVLGVESTNGPQGYAGYNVGGGAPVYYQQPGQAPTQGSGQAQQGAQVLTPAIYSGQVGSTANHLPQTG